ncbi:MAG: hypothetical protein A2275_18270 [Bacteroidetes bacterium RIFOXYA12_FULL_35_11]|nr:MAG: hypothetical protein A2X01_20835 [Bacteroidetes bacterium GWF2_35_48]OFY82708.1 MAG: hypothetical protein A2275_18270 [Bacteroidetes bacterium RIFOXYA12_FULL_35_11]OFY95036.1 MAG: hypothetical protein A2491_16775 [Bacteroidetes bacterium RIFOXYC12_FULL_35_7]HBX51810.1 sulfurtransferase [Bacteroidales bacterium]
MKNFFNDVGFEIKGIRHLSAREAMELITKGAVLIDLRDDFLTAMKLFDVPNYIICPLSTLDENIESLPKDKPLIVSDATGLKSKIAVEKLTSAGFVVANLAGGIMDWERDGYPVKKDPAAQLSGQCACMLKPMRKVKK